MVGVQDMLRYAAPWGQAFPEPLFDGEFECLQVRIMAEQHLRLTLRGAFNAPDAATAAAVSMTRMVCQRPCRKRHQKTIPSRAM